MLVTKYLICCGLAATAFAPLVVKGTAGDDELYGGPGDDILIGKAGDDELRADDGDDILNGGPGHDFLLGWNGDDRMHGGPGDDIVRGLEGDDVHIGGDGDDTLQLYQDAAPVFVPGPCPVGTDHDVAIGGDGDDEIQWGSARAYHAVFPLTWCITGGNSTADGGDGYDTILTGVGVFSGKSTDYVIEAGTVQGFPLQLRSLVNGQTLNFRNIEEIVFVDQTVQL